MPRGSVSRKNQGKRGIGHREGVRRMHLRLLIGVVAALAFGGLAAQAATPKPLPTAALVFRGMATDVVGRNQEATPNGERDGRFTATLVGRGAKRTLTHIGIVRYFAKGGYAEGWDTGRYSSDSVLGTYLNGKRLNPTDRDIRVVVAPGARLRFELYANDIGVFAPGQLYRVGFKFSDGTLVLAKTVLPGKPAQLLGAFAGRTQDIAGRGIDQKPNGEPDGHFRLTLNTQGAWRIVEDVMVRRLNTTGALDMPFWRMAGPQTAALFVNGQRYLWPSAVHGYAYAPLDPAKGPFTLDVYANDDAAKVGPGWFSPGQQYRIFVTFTDTQLTGELSVVVRIS